MRNSFGALPAYNWRRPGGDNLRDQLPPHYLELVADAALKSYWRRKALWTFLRRCGVSESFLATWLKEESKRDYLNRLFPKLEATGDAGTRLINRMADSLIQQTAFPDLEGWEDAEQKKKDAKRSVATLKEYRQSQRREAEQERDHKAARQRADEIQGEIRRRAQDLQKLSDRLTELSKELGKQQAGYDFQKWFYDVADYFEVVNRRPYVSNGRQIDGSITVDGTTYLIELKFTREQSDSPDIDSLHKKVTSKADNTMGIMISISGYSSTAIKEASGPKTPLLLLDHNHIYLLLSGCITLEELASRVRRHSSQTGEAYLSANAFST
jgi:hypothetical protein